MNARFAWFFQVYLYLPPFVSFHFTSEQGRARSIFILRASKGEHGLFVPPSLREFTFYERARESTVYFHFTSEQGRARSICTSLPSSPSLPRALPCSLVRSLACARFLSLALSYSRALYYSLSLFFFPFSDSVSRPLSGPVCQFHTAMYMSSYCYVSLHSYICVFILLCVLIPHTTNVSLTLSALFLCYS